MPTAVENTPTSLDNQVEGHSVLPSPSSDSGVVLSESQSATSDIGAASTVSNGKITTSTTEHIQNGRVHTEVPQTSRNVPPESGPDKVVPADNYITWDCHEPVKLRMQNTGPLSEKPVSVMTAFESTCKKVPNTIALAYKPDPLKDWVKWTYTEYYKDVQAAAKSFIQLGLEPCHSVGIIGFNSPQWFISTLGTIFAGGFTAGVYTTNTPEACHYVLDNSSANVCVVENDIQLQKVLEVRDRLPNLKAIVQYWGDVKEKYPNVYNWKEFMVLGKSVSDEVLHARVKAQAPNKCCTIIYTSGTTGNPKGVMLSHDNVVWTALTNLRGARIEFGNYIIISYLPLSHVAAQLLDHYTAICAGGTVYFAQPDALKLTWTAKVCCEFAMASFGKEVGVSYLPLSHIAAQMLDLYFPLIVGASVYFAQPDALKGSLGQTLKEVRPTIFLGVPRVWEKMMEKLQELGKSTTGIKRKIAIWAKDVGYRGNMSKMNGLGKKKRGSMPFGWGLADALLFKKVRKGLGLDRCRYCISGAAPIMRDTLNYFLSLDITLLEIYGMSESSAPHTVSLPWRFRISSVGQEMPGASTKLDNPDEDGNGEICFNGRHIFMGYLNEREKTVETFDDDAWLHSGDVGKKDDDGFLYITGRIKELIITAGGENIAPVLIEDTVKESLPCISNCMLIGDKKKFLSLLLTFKTDINQDTLEPQDTLSPVSIEWCRGVGSNAKSLSQILDTKDEKILRAIQAGIDTANSKSISRAQKIQKWSILPRDFSVPGGELGPTLKLKRPVVLKMYTNTINAFYAET